MRLAHARPPSRHQHAAVAPTCLAGSRECAFARARSAGVGASTVRSPVRHGRCGSREYARPGCCGYRAPCACSRVPCVCVSVFLVRIRACISVHGCLCTNADNSNVHARASTQIHTRTCIVRSQINNRIEDRQSCIGNSMRTTREHANRLASVRPRTHICGRDLCSQWVLTVGGCVCVCVSAAVVACAHMTALYNCERDTHTCMYTTPERYHNY